MTDQARQPTESPQPTHNENRITVLDVALFTVAAFGFILALEHMDRAGRQGAVSGGLIAGAIALGFLALTRTLRCR